MSDAYDMDRGEAESRVTSVLRADAVILMAARQAVEDGESSPEALIAARRALDREVRDVTQWPSEDDYARAATDFEQAGSTDDAVLLRQLAATSSLIARAGAEWNNRYEGRPPTAGQLMIEDMRRAGLIDIDPSAPYQGVDGALYEPGALAVGDEPRPILLISGRGIAEVVTDWPSFDAMTGWVASRGTTGSGPLTPPPARSDCRGWEEDQVLACLVSSPGGARQITPGLPPDTFTTDVRHDVYQAVMAIAGRRDYFTPEQVADELGRRIAALPPHATTSYGGPAGLSARAYLNRLATTVVSTETAAATASVLVQEDKHFRPVQPVMLTQEQASAPTQLIQQQPRPPQVRGPITPQL